MNRNEKNSGKFRFFSITAGARRSFFSNIFFSFGSVFGPKINFRPKTGKKPKIYDNFVENFRNFSDEKSEKSKMSYSCSRFFLLISIKFQTILRFLWKKTKNSIEKFKLNTFFVPRPFGLHFPPNVLERNSSVGEHQAHRLRAAFDREIQQTVFGYFGHIFDEK